VPFGHFAVFPIAGYLPCGLRKASQSAHTFSGLLSNVSRFLREPRACALWFILHFHQLPFAFPLGFATFGGIVLDAFFFTSQITAASRSFGNLPMAWVRKAAL